MPLRKIINSLLLLTSLVGYLEWGRDNKTFLFQAEAEVISKLFTDPLSAFHPLVLLPLAGQLALLITIFQKLPSRMLTIFGIAGIGILFVVILLAGVMGMNWKVVASTLPFLATAIYSVSQLRRTIKAKIK
jgi:hypothetical protein